MTTRRPMRLPARHHLIGSSMHRWFFVFAAVVAALALGLVFTFVQTGATQNTQAKPEVTHPGR